MADADDVVDVTAILGGFERRITSQHFKGGEVTALMGGCALDMRGAQIDGEAVINVFAVWGGITIKCPPDWTVVLHGTPIMGGFEEKTAVPAGQQQAPDCARLRDHGRRGSAQLMQGPFSSGRGAALYLLGCLLVALVLAALVASMTGAGWINSLLFVVPLLLLYAVACGFSTYYLCRAWPLTQQSGASILAVFCVSAVMASAGWTGLGNAWNALLQSAGEGIEMGTTLKASMFALGVALYGLTALGNYLVIELARARQSERRELEARVMAQDAELRMLRTQIDPHFLFNSLNSISALTSSNPAGARAMTLQLADFFRHSLGLEAHRKVTLEAEVAMALHFLAIEQVRFGDAAGGGAAGRRRCAGLLAAADDPAAAGGERGQARHRQPDRGRGGADRRRARGGGAAAGGGKRRRRGNCLARLAAASGWRTCASGSPPRMAPTPRSTGRGAAICSGWS